MKLSVLFLLLGILQLNAARISAQNSLVNLNMHNVKIDEVFKAIEKQSSYEFFYNDKQIDVNKLVSIDVKNTKISDVVTRLLESDNLTYKLIGKRLILVKQNSYENALLDAVIESQQQKKISGTVTDPNGQTMVGVTVSAKGTTKAVITDAKGNFSIEVVDKKVTLVFSFVGFVTQEYKLTGESTVNIVLVPSVQSLDEVVVVGYGTQKKGNLTGSVATVNSKVLEKIPPVGSITNALAGRLPGLISQQSSGSPGRDAASLSIRGFGGALIIVDGVESGFNNINPNEIESISILKDASAAIYGARAGNGVILVTTKRGNDGKPTITFNSSYSLQNITSYPKMMSSGQIAELDREGTTHQGYSEAQQRFSQAQVDLYYKGTDPNYPNTDWYNVLIRPFAPMQQHNLSISGGSDKIKYFGLIGYMDQGSMWRNSGGDFQRYNIRSNIDAKITDDLSMQIDFSNINESRKFPARDGNGDDRWLWADYWSTQPMYPSVLPDPSKLPNAGSNANGGAHITSNRDLSGFSDDDYQDIKASAALKYNFPFAKGLSARFFMNYAQNYDNTKVMNKPVSYYNYDYKSKIYTLVGTWSPEADLSQTDNKSRTITNQFSFNYDRVIAKDHTISALAMYESVDYSNSYITAKRSHFLTPAIEYLFGGSATDQYGDGSASEMGRESFIGRLNYSFKNKYLLEGTLRADASAKFPSDKRWGYFPSLSGGWRISEESFIKDNIIWLESLKLRGGMSNTGYDNVGNFAYLSGYQINKYYIFGSQFENGLASTGLPNPNLTWENMTTYNLGLDFSLFKTKLYGTFDVFYRKLKGIPATRILSLPSTFGASLPPENINSSNNRGFESVIGTRGSKGDFSWDISGNVSWSRAKWDHYDEPDYSADPEKARVFQMSGQWTDRIMGYKTDGLYTSQAEIDAMKLDQDNQGNKSIKPGDIKYIDVNKDGKLDWKDRVDIGKGSIPHWMFGLSANLQYKNFDFSALFQGAAGNYMEIVMPPNTVQLFTERWTDANDNPNATFPRWGSVAQGGGFSDFYLKKAGYIRIKTLTIGYNIPKELLKFAKINSLRIYFAGTNLFTLDRLKKYGLDPEAPSSTASVNGDNGGAGYLYYPQQRTFTFGLNLTL